MPPTNNTPTKVVIAPESAVADAQEQVPQQSAENIAQARIRIRSAIDAAQTLADAEALLAATAEPAAKAAVKYYHAVRANQPVVAGDHVLQFPPYEHSGGVWHGILAVTDAAKQAALDALIATKKTVVSAITEAEFALCQQKMRSVANDVGVSLLHTQNLARSVEPNGNPLMPQTINADLPASPTQVAPAQTTEDALAVGKVK